MRAASPSAVGLERVPRHNAASAPVSGSFTQSAPRISTTFLIRTSGNSVER